MEVRSKFYELLSHCIPPTVILKVITLRISSVLSLHESAQTVAERVADKVDEVLKAEIMHWAAFYVSPDIHCTSSRFECVGVLQEVRMRMGE
jgi:replication factor C subunit 3/5